MKKLLERLFPAGAARYREWRDRRLFAAQRLRPTALGFDFIGVEGMPESRTASGEVALLRELLAGRDLFVDVGANCGLYSLIASRAGVPVIAVEPNALNFRRLTQNLTHNGCDNARALNAALGDRRGKALLYGGGEGASLLRNWGGMASTYAREVTVETLDNLVADQPPDGALLIKVDVEGHELAVLSGARDLLRRTPSATWIVEHSFRENQDGRINPDFLALFEVFWSAGYDCLTFDPTRRPVRRADVEQWLRDGERAFGGVNYMFIRP